MNQWLQKIQTLVQQKGGPGDQGGNLAGLLAPGALGGLAGLLVANKSSRKMMGAVGKNALFIGGGAAIGAVLWDQYKKRVRETHQHDAQFTQPPTPIDRRTQRLVTALVFAAKADGHIDDHEQRAIRDNLQQLGLGEDVEHLVQDAIAQPLDPARLAQDIHGEDEALEIYYLSCAVVDVDHFMERSYMDALALALKIPDDVKTGLEQQLKAQITAVPPR
ncbi:tellurite resistance TerB family protein [Sodalis sp. C49]|uniref:tellurite resistance TerB family protein n=1 Tax=unclassified Sodalis (in: enterobacteria) TaxID=2636512 RepID=UPI0039659819